ncbi:putative phytanoylhydroxylase [Diaporthe ampelina]|uniref:Putative phytanoylhydroxylase n=1 Tax=Diaporthe ampelina TaxID=1214573 RepID=A0A0G2FP97_9PEZI|nr:putative phytanoylhydroxylase [Diaporthe ampelina]
MLTLPASILYGASLVLRDEMPTWPPSPAWVMTMMPWVSFSYNRIYYDILGGYERRLNKALRGRGLPNEQLPAAENPDGGQQANVAAENPAPAEEDDEGYFAQAMRVGNAVLNLMGDENNQEEVVAEIELHIGPEEDEIAAIQELQDELNDQGIVVVEERPAENAEAQAVEQPQEQNQSERGDQDAAEPPPPIMIEPQGNGEQNAPPNDNNNNNQAQEEPIRERNGGPSTTLTDLVNGVVTAITFPLVCWGAGEILRHALPDNWITRTHPRAATGLLQEQWGRSLVGGMVFIVARDAVNLYTKHRRVEVRKHRRGVNLYERCQKDGHAFLKGLLPRDDVLKAREGYFASLALAHHTAGWYWNEAGRGFTQQPALRLFVERLTGWGGKTLPVERTLLRNNTPGNKAIGVHYDESFMRLGEEFEKYFSRKANEAGMSDEDMRDALNLSMMSTGFLCDGPLEFGRKDGRRWLATAYEAGGVVLHQSNARWDKRYEMGDGIRRQDSSAAASPEGSFVNVSRAEYC